jgi:hypothetical protein
MSGARWREWAEDWAIDLAIGTACAVFLGLIGPFGSYFNGPAWQRVAFQIACFWLGVVIYGSMARAIARLRLKPAATWSAIIVGTAILTAPFQILVSGLGVAIWPILRVLKPLDWYVQGLLLAEPVVLGFTFLIRTRIRNRERAREARAAAARPLSQGALGVPVSAVLCLQMEDHYVRVHTQAGSRLVLTTMTQALAAVEAVDGLQVHRSWWVARKAVCEAVAEGRNLRLRLVNGVMAPVARSAVGAVRAAGWMEAAR